MRNFHLRIVTPDGVIYDGEAVSLLVRTDDGDVEFLAGHTDYFAHLGIGTARLITGEGTRYGSANGGFVSVQSGELTVAATTFEFAEDIDLNRATLAKERTESVISISKDQKEIDVAKAKLLRAINRIKVAELL